MKEKPLHLNLVETNRLLQMSSQARKKGEVPPDPWKWKAEKDALEAWENEMDSLVKTLQTKYPGKSKLRDMPLTAQEAEEAVTLFRAKPDRGQ